MDLPACRTCGAPLAGDRAAPAPALCPSCTARPAPPAEPPWWVTPATTARTVAAQARQPEPPWWVTPAPAAPPQPARAWPGQRVRRALLGGAALLLCAALALLVGHRPTIPDGPEEPETLVATAPAVVEVSPVERRIVRIEQPVEPDRPAQRLPRRLGPALPEPELPPPVAEPARPPAEAKPPAEVARLIQALAHNDAGVRLRAAKQLAERGRAAHWAVPELGKALRDRSPEVRKQAGQALAAVGAPAVPELVKALRQRDATLRARAARALALIGPEARDAVEVLTVRLRDGDVAVRAASVQALGEIGPEAKSSAPDLVRALRYGSDRVRGLALEALRSIGPGAAETLAQTLADGPTKERLASIQALGLLGPDARGALPQLRLAMRDRDTRLRAATTETLGRMGTEAAAAVPELIDALRDRTLGIQVQAAVTLVDLAEHGVPGVLEKIREADRKGSWAQAQVRNRFGAARPETVLKLKKELEAADPLRRLQAVLGLGQLAARSRAAADALKEALRDKDPHVRLAAAQALVEAGLGDVGGLDLKRIEDEARQRVTALLEARKAAVQALREQRLAAILRAMSDPRVQATLDRFIALYIVIKGKDRMQQTPTGVTWGPTPQLARIGALLDAALEALGPEAIPAIIKGMNTTALYKVGFC